MKKGVVIALVALALVVLVSPGLIGRLAERSVDESIRAGTVENEDIIVSAEIFERGWFTTEGQHRVELKDGTAAEQLRGFLGLYPGDELPVFIVTTRIDHGLIPLGAIGREDGSLAPGLGDAVSTVEIEMPDGEVVTVPGAINSHIGLTGTMTSTYELPAGAVTDFGQGIRWGDGTIDVHTDPGADRIEVDAELVMLELMGGGDGSFRLGRLSIEGEQYASGYGFSLGEGQLSIESMENNGPVVGPLDMTGKVAIRGGKLEIDFGLDMTSTAPGIGDANTTIELTARGIDPEQFGAFVRKYQAIADTVYDPMQASALIEQEAQALLAGGLTLDVPHFDIALPDGKFESSLEVEVEPAAADENFTWSSLLLATQANAAIRVPDSLMQTLISLNPEAGALLGLGYFVQDGDDWVTDARYAKGILTINGAPMTIPLTAP